jgi:predicted enzyme related to lactoylglutathione lyase
MIVVEGLDSVSLPVKELQESIKFYEDVFDFEILIEDKVKGEAVLKLNDIYLRLVEQKDYKPSVNIESFSFFVDSDDFQDVVNEIKERNIEIVAGPIPIRDGEKILIKDPTGNVIAIKYPPRKF